MTRQHHKSVYLSAPLRKALQERPDINVAQVCKVALEAATGLVTDPGAAAPANLSTTITRKLADTESQLRTATSTLEKIAKLTAREVDMHVLTKEEAEVYKDILKVGVKQFVTRTKQEAVEAYKEEQRRVHARKRKNKAAGLAPNPAPPMPEHESNPQEVQLCTDCGDLADVACLICGKPLCWTCWTGPDLDAPARETCTKCSEPEKNQVTSSDTSP